MVKTMAEIDLDEVRPKGFDATRLGARGMAWRGDRPATLYWAEALDGGDPKAETEERDAVYMSDAPFSAVPTRLATTSLRYGGITWGDDERAIMREQWWAKRIDKRTLFNPSKPGTAGEVIVERNTADRYNDPGSPMTKKNEYGWYVLNFDKDNLFMSSVGGSPEGDKPYLAKYNLKNKKTERFYLDPKLLIMKEW